MIQKKSLYSWVLERDRRLQALLLLMIFVTVGLRVLPLEMQKRIVNEAIALRRVDTLFLYCAFYFAAVVSANGLKLAINILQGYIGQKTLKELRSGLYAHILRLPLPFFRRTPAGMVISSLTAELSAVGEFLGTAIAVPVTNVLTLLAFGAFMFWLNPLLATLSLVIYPFEIFVIPWLQRRFNRLNTDRVDITRNLSNVVGEVIPGMHEVHGNGSYRFEEERFNGFAETLFRLRHRMNIYKYLIKFVNNFFQSLGPLILFLVGGYLAITGRFDLGALVAFLSAYEKLYDPWKELMDYYQSLQDSRVRYQRVMEYFDGEPEYADAPEGRPPVDLAGDIAVENVRYTVEGGTRLLDDVSLRASPGEHVAIVGFSGSGKSTLAMILGQIYGYDGGRVLVDGNELKNLTKLDVVRNLGFIAQQPFIFNGTIEENLLYGCRSMTGGRDGGSCPMRPKVLEVVRAVGLGEDIARLGLASRIEHGDGGDIPERIVRLRQTLQERHGAALADDVEFFEEDRYLRESSLAVNLLFGSPKAEDYANPERLAARGDFRSLLLDVGLDEPLAALGRAMARQTVLLLKDLPPEDFFFRDSPIPLERFETYREIIERIEKAPPDAATGADREAFIALALRFIPARHKMVGLPSTIERLVLSARPRIMEEAARLHPGAFTFYRRGDYIHPETILDNILFGRPKAGRPQAVEHIRQTVTDLLQSESIFSDILEVGLRFPVGAKGDRLSGGQKQKVAIARALLKDPPIIIMDEATASLDNASQSRIQELIATEFRGKSTVIAVVHRLDTLQGFDRIAVMRAGKIIESGTYDALVARKGAFHALVHGN